MFYKVGQKVLSSGIPKLLEKGCLKVCRGILRQLPKVWVVHRKPADQKKSRGDEGG